jgi:Protein of unknown function (DUF3176)
MSPSERDHSDEIALREWEQHQADILNREKKEPVATVTEHQQCDDPEGGSLRDHWNTGLKARFPWIGVAALVTMLMCMGLVVLILATSNNKAQEEWPVYMKFMWINDRWKSRTQLTPSTALAIVNTVSNLALAIAIGQGIAIAWWRKALIGATVEDLHKSWGYGTSVLALATSYKNFNLIALAALAAKLALVDNTLLQRSAGTVPGQFQRSTNNLQVPILQSLPANALGQFDDSSGVGYVTTMWQEVLYYYALSNTLIGLDSLGLETLTLADNNTIQFEWPTHCTGTCETYIEGFGFNLSCTPYTQQSFNITPAIARDNALNQSSLGSTDRGADATLLSLKSYTVKGGDVSTNAEGNIETSFPEPWISLSIDYANVNAAYIEDGAVVENSCSSIVSSSTCSLRPAVVRYPIAITNYTSMAHANNGINITLGDFVPPRASAERFGYSGEQTYGAKVVRPLYQDEPTKYFSNIDAVGRVVRSMFNADVSLQYLNGFGYAATPSNTTSPSYWVSAPADGTCSFYVPDPTVGIIDQINMLMLRASLSSSVHGNPPHQAVQSGLSGIQIVDTVRFKSEYAFIGAALALMFICILAVIPTFYGYWELGRKVTLGPMEIASAFRAPVLQHPKVVATGEVDVLLKEVGDRKVRYGEVEGTGTLGVAEPQIVRRLIGPAASNRHATSGDV